MPWLSGFAKDWASLRMAYETVDECLMNEPFTTSTISNTKANR